MARLVESPIDFAALTESVRRPGCGAVVLFLGTVRDLTGDEVTTHLDYSAYPAMAEEQLAAVEAEASARWPGCVPAVVHRVGRLAVGEVSVAVAAAAPHRAEAFDAARFLIDTIKARVPIWKKDIAPGGTEAWRA
jgi:molybdopterin synthase catalytic subunit